MISVKDAVADLDRQAREAESRKQNAERYLSSWENSLLAVEAHLFPLFPSAARKTEADWRMAKAAVRWPAPGSPDGEAPRLVEVALHRYADESRQSLREDLDAVKTILEAMASAASAARVRTDHHGGNLRGVYQSLRRLVELDDLDQLREQLTVEAAQLRDSVEQMVWENHQSLAAMESDLLQFRERLERAETAASTDALTGLANRREFEKQLEARIGRTEPFSVLLFDLDYFKTINDRFGHDAGDQVLRTFAGLLHEQVRPGDVVARWGGDEFMVIFDCALSDALRRSQQISRRLDRRYEIQFQGKTIQVPIRASSGVVQRAGNETAAELFRRVDGVMYAAKGRR